MKKRSDDECIDMIEATLTGLGDDFFKERSIERTEVIEISGREDIMYSVTTDGIIIPMFGSTGSFVVDDCI